MCLSLKKLHQDWKIEQWSKKVRGLDLDLKAYEILIKELKSWKSTIDLSKMSDFI